MADNIRPSPELVAVARRFFQAIEVRDGATLRNMFSESEYLTFIGSAEHEIWTGRRVRDGFEDHVRELPPFRARIERAEAYECGPVGWVFVQRRVWMQDRAEPVVFRMSLVFALQQGSWRIVHRHASLPAPNSAIHDNEHRALEALVQAAQADSPMHGQTGIAAIMFTDIADSSTIAEVLGDTAWSALIKRHVQTLASEIERGSGRLIKSLGDGTMSSFGSARAAMQTARAIQTQVAAAPDEPRLQLRIGLHTGEVVASDADFFGTVVNKAARIAALARPGEIRISDATKIMVGASDNFDVADPTSVRLKGLEGEHTIYRLEWHA